MPLNIIAKTYVKIKKSDIEHRVVEKDKKDSYCL